MNLQLRNKVTLAVTCLFTAAACMNGGQDSSRESRAELERQLASSQALASRYEKRYGKLQPARTEQNFRTLRAQLKGKRGSAVVALLGKPAKVYASGTTESWEYSNAAYDPVSGRTVRLLQVWFRSGVVEYMNAIF